MRKKIIALALLVGLGLGAMLGTHAIREARAQSVNFTYQTAGGYISISAATPAILISATTGKQIVVIGMKLAAVSTGGPITFYNGANAANTLFAGGNGFTAYCPASTTANNNVDIGASLLPIQGSGVLATSAGSALCAQLGSCTLCYQIQYYLQ